MDAQHLQLLRECVPEAQRPRLSTVVGTLPQVAFPAGSFGAILASRVLHFLAGDEMGIALRRMHDWLLPGGQLYLVADSPYMPSWLANMATYKVARDRGEPWPGLIADFGPYRQPGATGPAFLNTLDPDTLARECRNVGLQVLKSDWFSMHRLGGDSNGREHAACIARRPV